jgi:hypothetical protein
MDFGTITIPAGATTLGALLGPFATIAVMATLVTLGVVIVGLVFERRESASIRRLRAAPRPIVAAAGSSARRAA